MGKNFHFQTPFHFLNFCNKYINLEEEDKKVLEYFIDKKAYHDNICLCDFTSKFSEILDSFKQILLITQGIDYQILKGKNEYTIKEIKNSRAVESLEHNKKKKYNLSYNFLMYF